MTRGLLKLGSIVAVLAALGLYLWWSTGIPSPREQDRVHHQNGFYSIIKPRDWEMIFNPSGSQQHIDTLRLRFPSNRARDQRIFVGRLRHPPDLERAKTQGKLIDTQFQGQPAWVFQGRTRTEHFWRALFERYGQWYELVLWLPLPEDVPRSGYWPFLQSFRANDVPATRQAAPAPATQLPDWPVGGE